jgi:hypothetical protein
MLIGLCIGFAVVAALGSRYVLRRDTVVVAAAQLFRELAPSGSLVVFSANHDRVIGRGSQNPAFFYYAQSRGWNAALGSSASLDAVEACRGNGAEFLVCTYFTSDLELPFGKYLPRSIRNEPFEDFKAWRRTLDLRYEIAAERKNVVIYRLRSRTSVSSAGGNPMRYRFSGKSFEQRWKNWIWASEVLGYRWSEEELPVNWEVTYPQQGDWQSYAKCCRASCNKLNPIGV